MTYTEPQTHIYYAVLITLMSIRLMHLCNVFGMCLDCVSVVQPPDWLLNAFSVVQLPDWLLNAFSVVQLLDCMCCASVTQEY